MNSINSNNKKKYEYNYAPSTRVSFRYSAIALIITFILMIIVPKILNYGPGSINTQFDIQMSYISYSTQFTILSIVIILGIIILTKILLRDIDKWCKDESQEKFNDLKRLKKVRKQCMNLPYVFFAIEIFVPFLAALVVLSITGSHSPIMIAKILVLLISFAFLLAVVSFIFSRDLNESILSQTYVEGYDIGFKVPLNRRVFLLIFPIFISSLLLVALVGYSSSVIEEENIIFNIYSNYLDSTFDKTTIYTHEELRSKLSEMKLLNSNDVAFILYENEYVDIVRGKDVSNFVIEYTKQLSAGYEGRIYDSYGVDTQGSSIRLITENGICYVGILYNVYAETAFEFLATTVIFLLIIVCIILYIFSNSLSKNLHKISEGFESIYNDSNTSTLLPVTSNDEIGELVIAFNKIQKLNKEHLNTIKNNQDMLIERERLASLGQMVGGVAHNLKTPIFSISGGIEGLSDLIKEFDESIDDPSVNNEDMHEIAKDMNVWIEKMKGHLSYMSEVITTVKGQAVNLSGNDTVKFSIEELFNHTQILMKHELQRALIDLNVENNIKNDVILNGNMNSLVQVLNNLISNAVQAYKGKAHEKIDLKANLKGNNIIITIKDYGPGIPDSVKDKIFKKMITTKGKEGTGLGLFMSYSTIKAKFNGDIKFETSSKGTEFNIILPI